jgi:glycosyltransferase 2 family protein
LVVLCVAHGLPGVVPSAAEHFLIVPLSNVAGAIPITPNGLGTFELAMDSLYVFLGGDRGVVQGTGTIVALGYRFTNIAVAAGAAVYYVSASGGLAGLRVAKATGATQSQAALDGSGGASCK